MTGFAITTDPSALDVDVIHGFLSGQSGWARGIPRALVEKSLRHSLCFAGLLDGRQIAFARVISDYATFANLVDVFVLPEHRGRGYGERIVEAVLAHPELQGLRRFTLATFDAHGLYAKYGFTPPSRPQTLMERYTPDIYQRAQPA